jgi:hypothetical protein
MAGRYALREQVGAGGMGEIWVADQTEPIRRRVVLSSSRPRWTRNSCSLDSRPSGRHSLVHQSAGSRYTVYFGKGESTGEPGAADSEEPDEPFISGGSFRFFESAVLCEETTNFDGKVFAPKPADSADAVLTTHRLLRHFWETIVGRGRQASHHCFSTLC